MHKIFKIFSHSRILIDICLIFILPVFLLYFNIIPRDLYLFVLFLCIAFVAFIMVRENWTLRNLNIRTDNFKITAIPYIIFTFIAILFLSATSIFFEKEEILQNLLSLFFIWSFPIGIAQEFLYRGFLIPRLKKIFKSISVIVLVNALIFTFMHILESNFSLNMLLITFTGGVGFAYMYVKYPNLILISLCHAILNFVAIWYGFF